MRRLVLSLLVMVVGLSPVGASAQTAGGPIVLMGIDAEDGGPGGHGPIENYADVVNSILGEVSKPGAGILVIGGGKAPSDGPTTFWDEIAAQTGEAVTYVNTGPGVTGADFSPFKMLGVVSDVFGTGNGLSQEEHDALSARKDEVASFINGGGGLLGFASGFDPAFGAPPYDYMSVVGGFTIRINLSYEDINPTPDGQAIGVTDDLDVCCWHNTFTSHPGFLQVLATNADPGEGSGEPAALGGENVFVGEEPPSGEGNTSIRFPRPLFTAGPPGKRYKVIMFGIVRSDDPRCRNGRTVEALVNGKVKKATITDSEGDFIIIFKLRRIRIGRVRVLESIVAGYGGSFRCPAEQSRNWPLHPPGKKGRQAVGR